MKNVVEANQLRDLYLTDGTHVYLLPKGWCDEWSIAQGFEGGLDWIGEDDKPEPEIMCYAPTHTTPNSPVETLFVAVATLETMNEVSEADARVIHPELFAELERINAGG